MASIACGDIGIMIEGTLVSMKAYNPGLTLGNVFKAFEMAIIDIVRNGRQGKSVINISLGKSIMYIMYKMIFVQTNLLYYR